MSFLTGTATIKKKPRVSKVPGLPSSDKISTEYLSLPPKEANLCGRTGNNPPFPPKKDCSNLAIITSQEYELSSGALKSWTEAATNHG